MRIMNILVGILVAVCVSSGAESDYFHNNEGQPKNALGYYGATVYFGGHSIVGDWKSLYGSYVLNENGTGTVHKETITQYGISADGRTLYYTTGELGESGKERIQSLEILDRYYSADTSYIIRVYGDLEYKVEGMYCYLCNFWDNNGESVAPLGTYMTCKEGDDAE
jgi:hypothetical protein